jgi:quercetin dioxygenase-like cupin family protein
MEVSGNFEKSRNRSVGDRQSYTPQNNENPLGSCFSVFGILKEHPVFKGAQTVILVGDPTKAETIVQRVKLPPHYKVPPHTHPYSEVVTVLSGTYWNAMADDQKGVALKPGSVFLLPANRVHHTWTEDEEVIVQVNFTGPGGVTFVNAEDDPRKK